MAGQGIVVRNSNIELLRIIAMLLIIGGHVVRFGTSSIGNYDITKWYGGTDFAIGNLIYAFCIVAVNVYVLISGYFGIKFSLHKLIRLECLILFYSFLLLAAGLYLGWIHLLQIPAYILPTLSSKWWFITTYMVLCLMSPLLNHIVDQTSKKQLKSIVFAGFLLFYVWATLSYTFNFKQLVPSFGGNIINFVVLYFTGRYIRLYYKDNLSSWQYLVYFLLLTLGMYAIQLCFSHILGFAFASFSNDDSAFVFASAVCLFLGFKNLSFTVNWVNRLATYALAVYIIHMNNIVMPFIIRSFRISSFHGLQILIGSVLIPLAVYLACVIIEQFRRMLFGRIESNIIERFCKTLQQRCSLYRI